MDAYSYSMSLKWMYVFLCLATIWYILTVVLGFTQIVSNRGVNNGTFPTLTLVGENMALGTPAMF